MTEQEIQQEVEELLEAIKVHGFPALSELGDLPKFAYPVCSRVSSITGIAEKVIRVYYYRRENEST